MDSNLLTLEREVQIMPGMGQDSLPGTAEHTRTFQGSHVIEQPPRDEQTYTGLHSNQLFEE